MFGFYIIFHYLLCVYLQLFPFLSFQVTSFILLLYLVLYLKIQHNIGIKGNQLSGIFNARLNENIGVLNENTKMLNESIKSLSENTKILRKIETELNQKFNEQKNIQNGIIDFFESLLKYLENEKREKEKIAKKSSKLLRK